MSTGGMTIQGAIVLVVVACLNGFHAQAVAIGFAGVSIIAAVLLYLLRVRVLRQRAAERHVDQAYLIADPPPTDPAGSAAVPEAAASDTPEGATGGEMAHVSHEPAARAWRSPLLRARPQPLLLVAVICTAAFVPAPVHDSFGHNGRATAIELAAALATAFSALFVSTLVDWFYVAPMLRQGDDPELMLCRSSLGGQWRSMTQVWLFHRLGAVLGFVLGLVAVVTLLASRLIHFNQVAAGAIAALTTVLAGFYLARARDVIAFAVRPAFHVGDKIQLASDDEQERKRTYFVVDVALEGVRLLEVAGGNDEVPEQFHAWREHDRILDFAEAAKLLRRRRRLKPCGLECKRVNAYCPLNQEPPRDGKSEPQGQEPRP